MSFKPPDAWSASPTVASSGSSSSIVTAEKAISFISKGWREVRSSADADLQLLKNRANSFKNLADRELENFLNSASKSPFSVPTITASATLNPAPYTEIDFVKRLQPKLSEIKRVYSSPDFKFYRRPQIKIDLSSIKNAIASEVGVEEDDGESFRRWRMRFKEKEREEGQFGEFWEPIKTLKSRLRELEHKSSSEILEGIKNSEFVEKFKSSLKSIYKDPNESKEVLPLDVPELLACLFRQSSPFLDHFGINKGISDKIVESLCSKRKSQLVSRSLPSGGTSMIESENINDELDLRIASVIQSTGHCHEGGFWGDIGKQDMSDKKRHVAIVTTASLPWMTGTSVNPLFRAAYLANSAKQNVTLLVPWLCRSDQELVYPNNLTFSSPEEQESYIRSWLEERIGFKADFKISFYPGKFSKARRSILPSGDTSHFISSKDADIAILEEPEHLNWYHHGKRWTDKFNHVVGVVHTNYLEYIKREKNGALQAFFVKHINNWVVRAYCHKVLRLSAATQDLPKSVICNVHGVNPKFLRIGEKVAAEKDRGEQTFSKGAYFLGKMVWAKGYKELIYLLEKHKKDLDGFNLDVYGNGEDAHEVQSTAKRLNLNLNFMKGRDHADDSLQGYKIFINPSVSDVLCTATAEALAMGKFVVCADHPSNDFFRSFPNCLTYKTPEDFVTKVKEAMVNEPQPLTPEQRYTLSWEAATQRFMEFSELDKILNNPGGRNLSGTRNKNNGLTKSASLPNLNEMVDGGLAFAHYCLTGNELLRLCTGATPGTMDYDKQHSEDLNLSPPHVENPIYGW
ncbi:Digalactosyldiacylglycerol synthase 1, chloroplastic [Castilleja foliolosa]|uniref:Digalactosyldiacylglycerol synthase 1, chloroplastic n=1 Tax=Castilleja foliolosa TaxID=1961234 RepID=A0ABD3DKC2_9LAMI